MRRPPIPFFKAHAARNDFLMTWSSDLPAALDLAQAAQDLCDRHAGIGADGWYVLSKSAEADVAAKLYNADGSGSELSGNGSRCVAALLFDAGHPRDTPVRILTGAGLKSVRMVGVEGGGYRLEMEMGRAPVAGKELLQYPFGEHEAVILTVGNPQCAVPVDDFNFDWRAAGAALERHPRFLNRTNVSFVRKAADVHNVEVRIWERGVGETQSSGTGCTGAAAAARFLGWVETPVAVLTAAGPLDIRWEGEEYFLTGPAQVIAKGEFR
ncbi:MAG: diaminopimelate epimerase [Bryobacteraceae bacterium]